VASSTAAAISALLQPCCPPQEYVVPLDFDLQTIKRITARSLPLKSSHKSLWGLARWVLSQAYVSVHLSPLETIRDLCQRGWLSVDIKERITYSDDLGEMTCDPEMARLLVEPSLQATNLEESYVGQAVEDTAGKRLGVVKEDIGSAVRVSAGNRVFAKPEVVISYNAIMGCRQNLNAHRFARVAKLNRDFGRGQPGDRPFGKRKYRGRKGVRKESPMEGQGHILSRLHFKRAQCPQEHTLAERRFRDKNCRARVIARSKERELKITVAFICG